MLRKLHKVVYLLKESDIWYKILVFPNLNVLQAKNPIPNQTTGPFPNIPRKRTINSSYSIKNHFVWYNYHYKCTARRDKCTCNAVFNLQSDLKSEVDRVVEDCISFCNEHNISDPVSILRIYQSKLVTGRPLELSDETSTSGIEGETNILFIDRANIIQTAIDEVNSLTDLRKCVEIQFYGEV